jgi:NAD(P)-dependent dehydrogenase (short-subunit alcohol dehydrogenase family)
LAPVRTHSRKGPLSKRPTLEKAHSRKGPLSKRPTLEKDCGHERSLRKTALVTGASRGIGRASALALAKAGAQVVVHYGRGAKEAEAVVAEIRNTGGRADMVAADLAAPDGAHTLAKRVRGIVGDRLDILVLNAGVSKAATIEDTTVEDFDHLFAVNARAPFFLVQGAAAKPRRKRSLGPEGGVSERFGERSSPRRAKSRALSH